MDVQTTFRQINPSQISEGKLLLIALVRLLVQQIYWNTVYFTPGKNWNLRLVVQAYWCYHEE